MADREDLSRELPPFAMLRAFEVVGRVGGIRRAAEILSLDHTVVSRHVRALEERLGVALVARDGRGLRLTSEGRAYHARLSVALLDLVAATREIASHRATQYLRIWCVPGFAAQWLSTQIAEFERLHPGMVMEVRPTDHSADLSRFEADVDIRFCGDDWGVRPETHATSSVEIARPPLLVVASPALAAGLALRNVRDLAAAQLLHEEDHGQWRAWLTRNGLPPAVPIGGILLWHAHLAIAAARQGRGVALANRYLVAADLQSGALVEVAFPGCEPATVGSYRFTTRMDRARDPAIVALRDFLLQRAAS